MLTRLAFSILVLAQVAVRVAELAISRRHQRVLAQHGAAVEPEPGFVAMVALHAAIFGGAVLEVWVARRPFQPWLAGALFVLLMTANALRWWVIATLREHWNVRVVRSVERLGVVSSGPYRLVRHPNYVAVFVELLALPLLHGAWITASAGGLLHLAVLRSRISFEERSLLADGGYRQEMAWKPRFIPRLFGRPSPPAPQLPPG